MDNPEYIVFGFQNDMLPEIIVRDLNEKPFKGAGAGRSLPYGEYTLRWDVELLDWVIAPLPGGPSEQYRQDLRDRLFPTPEGDKQLILGALREASRSRRFSVQDVRDWVQRQKS